MIKLKFGIFTSHVRNLFIATSYYMYHGLNKGFSAAFQEKKLITKRFFLLLYQKIFYKFFFFYFFFVSLAAINLFKGKLEVEMFTDSLENNDFAPFSEG